MYSMYSYISNQLNIKQLTIELVDDVAKTIIKIQLSRNAGYHEAMKPIVNGRH